MTTEVPSTTAPSTTEPETTTSTTEPVTEPTVPTTTEAPTTAVTPTTVEAHKSTTIVAQSDSSTPVGWIIGGVVALLLVVLAVVLFSRSRSRRRARDTWRTEVEPVLAQTTMVRDRLVGAQSQDPAGRAAITEQLQSVTSSLARVANSAPSDELTAAANAVGENLRGLSFAQEASDLLRSGTAAPSGQQLARADQDSRTQLAQLDAAIATLRAQIERAGER